MRGAVASHRARLDKQRIRIPTSRDHQSSLQWLFSTASPWAYPGLGIFHRNGYREADLVDYGTRNAKGSAAVHIRTDPDNPYESPELIIASNFGWGTTVYQGDNRFSLKNIFFFQNRLEFRKKDKYFIRTYMTKEDAGDSYDPYFTALRLQERAMSERRLGWKLYRLLVRTNCTKSKSAGLSAVRFLYLPSYFRSGSR